RGIASLFGLAPGGVCRAGLLPGSRCALTAPFHPCLIPPPLRAPGHRRSALCCTFRRLAPPRRYLAPCPVEPGLSSACLRMTRLPGRLRAGILRVSPRRRSCFAGRRQAGAASQCFAEGGCPEHRQVRPASQPDAVPERVVADAIDQAIAQWIG